MIMIVLNFSLKD